MLCTAQAVVPIFARAVPDSGRNSPRRQDCVPQAERRPALLRQASVGLAGALAAASLSLQSAATEAGEFLPPLQKLLSPNKEQSYVYEGKQLFDPMACELLLPAAAHSAALPPP